MVDNDRRHRREDMPAEQRDALRRAIRIEWIAIGILVVDVIIIGLVAGQSQAMRVSWAEDALALLPPIAFLVSIRAIRAIRSRDYPYGRHRSIGVGQLVASVALLGMGLFLLVHSAMGLIAGERPPIGLTVLFGVEFWSGWLMIIVIGIFGIPSFILAPIKMKYARILHNKVLYADADMNKADWMTSVATMIGVLGVGYGLWWADAAAAIAVSTSIISDGVKNLRATLGGLMDKRARTFDEEKPHPLIEEVERHVADVDWVAQAASRVRDQGQVFHVEVFVVPHSRAEPTAQDLADLRERLLEIDWKVYDVVVALLPEIPQRQVPTA
ncbi:cation transporter [Dietzia lutea]|uniref:Cobalt transporter n=1 Tax=Dietzia lutea TaxID=546160 RepID=A0A2S1R3U7_9ACTN|nr:cation transporter [Dietzia lutea]AWH90957.1 cobalt transporter [Dietzia lutea]